LASGLLSTLYLLYFFFFFIAAVARYKSLAVGWFAVWATVVQFAGYGYGFLYSVILLNFSNKKPEELFPDLFFTPDHG
jgi:hypothetical protein